MASSRILDSRYFDKLVVNRLDAQEIKSGTSGPFGPSGPSGPSYLFSLLLKDATFKPNTTGGTLTFDLPLHSNDNVIMFSDRPFRQTSFISFTEFISAFTSDNSNNSFEKDPPNAVLTHSEEQRTYIVRYSATDSTTVTFNLELLPGETNVSSEVIKGQMNLFVDGLPGVDVGVDGEIQSSSPWFGVVPSGTPGWYRTLQCTAADDNADDNADPYNLSVAAKEILVQANSSPEGVLTLLRD